jgi:hypothetical protein
MTVTESDLEGRPTAVPHDEQPPTRLDVRVTAMEDFAAVDEPGADALLGDPDSALIPEGGDVMIYGDGGAGKTTLALDAGCHLAAGDAWLGIQVARPVRVLVIENEGPRPLFRRKARCKLAGWSGSPLGGRLGVLCEPWAQVTLSDASWRTELAKLIRDGEIDVVIAGPVTRLGMDDAGTLQQVRDFMRCVEAVRVQSGRRLTVILVHHENKGGTVSGAWEGAGDTLLHVEARGPGHTCVAIEKARWSSEHHGKKLNLAWAEGEGFAVDDARDYVSEIARLLSDGVWRTAKEIANKREASAKPGIGAGQDTVRLHLKERRDLFVERNGKEVGRSANATVYGLTSAGKSDGSDNDLQGAEKASDLLTSPLREVSSPESAPVLQQAPTSPSKSDEYATVSDSDLPSGWTDERLQEFIDREPARSGPRKRREKVADDLAVSPADGAEVSR